MGTKRRSRKVPVQPVPAEPSSVIEEIYTGTSGATPTEPLQRIEHTAGPRFPKRLLVAFAVLLVLVGVSVAGFLAFNRPHRFNERSVQVSIDVPTEVASAGESSFTLTVQNDENVAVRSAELTFTGPDGWTFQSSDPRPADQNGTLWQLGTIPPHAKRSVRVVGTLVGDVGSAETFNALVTYRPVNFNYDFTARASGTVRIGTSTVSLELQGPTQASPNAPVTYVLTYTNTSEQTIRDLHLIVTYPQGWTARRSDPKPSTGSNEWRIDELASGAAGTITIEGAFGGTVGNSVELTVAADLGEGPTPTRQVETSIVVLLVAAALDVHLTVNDVETAYVAKPGEKLTYVVRYENASDLEVNDVVFTVRFSGGAFEAKRFSDDVGVAVVNGAVTWTSQRIPTLAAVKPKATGTVRFSLVVPDVPDATSDAGGPTISSQLVVTTASANAGKPDERTLDPLVVKVASNPSLNVDPRYYDDDGAELGSGPIPPVVGQTTTYRVTWYLGNTTNELTGVSVVAEVPGTVFWTGRNSITSAGDLSFDPSTRKVTWTLNRLPPGVGKDAPTLTASFDLSITPTSAEAGTIVTLLGASTLSAVDHFTSTPMTLQRDRATTDLPNDPRAAGKGVVVP